VHADALELAGKLPWCSPRPNASWRPGPQEWAAGWQSPASAAWCQDQHRPTGHTAAGRTPDTERGAEVPEGFLETDAPFSHLNIFGTPEELPGDVEPGLAKTPR
jgi:hypothetical protein